MSLEFKIPYARSASGVLVHLSRASKGRYGCPECGEEVVFRKEAVRSDGTRKASRHFAHMPDPSGRACSGGIGEGVRHKTAKAIVAQEVQQEVDGESLCPWLVRTCSAGHERREYINLRNVVKASREEGHPALPSGRRPDVYLDLEDGRVSAIEILHSHRVDDEKREIIASELAWWIEIDVASVLEPENGWKVTQSSDDACLVCDAESHRKMRREMEWLKQEQQAVTEQLEEHKHLETELHQLRLRLDSLKDQRETAEHETGKALTGRSEAVDLLDASQGELSRLRAEVDEAKRDAVRLREAIDKARAELKEREEALRRVNGEIAGVATSGQIIDVPQDGGTKAKPVICARCGAAYPIVCPSGTCRCGSTRWRISENVLR